MQEDPAARVDPHVPNPPKAKSPVIEPLAKVMAALPLFVIVEYCTALVEPTAALGKVNDVGERDASPADALVVVLTAAREFSTDQPEGATS